MRARHLARLLLAMAIATALALAWWAASQRTRGVAEGELAPSAPIRAPAGNRAPVTIGGVRFLLEVAADPRTQFRGLGGRQAIAPDGGMIFVYPNPRPLAFVMRDCPVPIDVAFLDREGRIMSVHTMEPEAQRGPGESPAQYEARLRRYPSPLPAQFVIEIAGGRMAALGVQSGDLVRFDRRALLARLH
jgi:uncharacterized membrane protein (UPF0127 family)